MRRGASAPTPTITSPICSRSPRTVKSRSSSPGWRRASARDAHDPNLDDAGIGGVDEASFRLYPLRGDSLPAAPNFGQGVRRQRRALALESDIAADVTPERIGVDPVRPQTRAVRPSLRDYAVAELLYRASGHRPRSFTPHSPCCLTGATTAVQTVRPDRGQRRQGADRVSRRHRVPRPREGSDHRRWARGPALRHPLDLEGRSARVTSVQLANRAAAARLAANAVLAATPLPPVNV